MYLFSKLPGIGPTRRKLYRLRISKTEKKHKEHHRTNNQEWYIFVNHLNNIAV